MCTHNGAMRHKTVLWYCDSAKCSKHLSDAVLKVEEGERPPSPHSRCPLICYGASLSFVRAMG